MIGGDVTDNPLNSEGQTIQYIKNLPGPILAFKFLSYIYLVQQQLDNNKNWAFKKTYCININKSYYLTSSLAMSYKK